MSVDVTKVQFYGGYTIDKITTQGTLTYNIPTGSLISPSSTVQKIANPYQKRCLTSASYSTDGLSFYDQTEDEFYFDPGLGFYETKLTVRCGCDDNTIYFWIKARYSPLTVTINYTLDNIL